jgi:hypothetical protein
MEGAVRGRRGSFGVSWVSNTYGQMKKGRGRQAIQSFINISVEAQSHHSISNTNFRLVLLAVVIFLQNVGPSTYQ